jgi:hypothetical protein
VFAYFDEASRPETIVTSRAAEICGNPAGIVEWLMCKQRADLVPAFVTYFLARNLGWCGGVQGGRALATSGAALPAANTDMAVRLGWVLEANQPSPPAP